MVIRFKRNNQTYIDVCARRDEGSKETEADWEPAAAARARPHRRAFLHIYSSFLPHPSGHLSY